jgi:hypothetical protein
MTKKSAKFGKYFALQYGEASRFVLKPVLPSSFTCTCSKSGSFSLAVTWMLSILADLAQM